MATVYHGTDVNYSQMSRGIDWATYAANKDFVWFEAAGGNGIQLGYGTPLYTEGYFLKNQPLARAQSGLRIGYYFFGDTHASPIDSANYFINVIGTLNNGEVVGLDIEPGITNHVSPPTDGWAYDFCTTLKNYYGFTPVIYINEGNNPLNWPTASTVSNLWMADWNLSATNFSVTIGVTSAWTPLTGYPSSYEWLQYADNGTAPGINGLVDLDSFYSPNNTLSDWDALGYGGASPPPPSPGDLTFATVIDPTMTYTQPSKQTINLPKESYDQVLFSTTHLDSFTYSAVTNRPGPPTGLTQYAYPIGNYSYSINGVEYNLNDYGFINAGDFGQFPGTLPKVVVQPIVSSNGSLSFDVAYNPSSGDPSNPVIALILNIALMAYPNTTKVPVSSVRQQVARSNAIAHVSPSAYSTYRRIYSDKSVGTGATTVAHNQSTIPNILFWVQDNAGDLEPQPVTWASDGHTTAFGISMDSTNIYFNVDAANNAKCWYRLYLDN